MIPPQAQEWDWPPASMVISIDYTNWEGERRKRRIAPIPGTLRYCETPHHKPAQWVFDALDMEKNPPPRRTFALLSIHGVTVPTFSRESTTP